MNIYKELEINNQDLKKYVLISIAAHILIVLIFTVKAVFFTGEPIAYESAIRVDLVALPDKLKPQDKVPTPSPTEIEKPASPKETVKPTPKEKVSDAINLNPNKQKEAALKKLKQISAIEEIEKELQEENKRKALEKLQKFKGNVLSSGSELTGVAKLQHDNYIATVEKQIRQNWEIPEWLSNKNLKAQVRVRFDENGNVISKDIFKSSGNPTFDDLALDTVQKSSPVPPPPAKFVRILSVEGLLLGFPE